MDIRAVVAIDFGTTFSGFAYTYRSSPEIITNDSWPQQIGNIPQNEKPPLPRQLSYEKAISDYLRELEFDDRAKDTMRKCLHNAGLTNSKESNKIEFTTEPEAAAIYCMRNLEGQDETIPINASFMVVDCGGGTVDLTTRGFSESKYLQMRVKKEFGNLVPSIIVPKQPIAAIVRGACDYGLTMSTIVDRTLKYTYGVRVGRIWKEGDPPSQKVPGLLNRTYAFDSFVIRGTRVGVDQEFSKTFKPPEPNTTKLSFTIFKTTKLSAELCNEPGMKLHGTLIIDLPDVHLGLNREVEFSLIFGKMELVAKAKNLRD
ncbi:unnamed protein product [Rhizophagus irregularis]|nr:unnamed protein product [Rhizophagus irregularis]